MHGSCYKIVYLALITLFRITFYINRWISAAGTKYTMICSYISVLFALVAVCGKDFMALGRYQWRCKQRVHSNPTGPEGDSNIPSCHRHSFSCSLNVIVGNLAKEQKDSAFTRGVAKF